VRGTDGASAAHWAARPRRCHPEGRASVTSVRALSVRSARRRWERRLSLASLPAVSLGSSEAAPATSPRVRANSTSNPRWPQALLVARRPAPTAAPSPVPDRLGRRGEREVPDVLGERTCPAPGPAVDPGGYDGGERGHTGDDRQPGRFVLDTFGHTWIPSGCGETHRWEVHHDGLWYKTMDGPHRTVGAASMPVCGPAAILDGGPADGGRPPGWPPGPRGIERC
jgi:hypothetical protein